MMDVIVLNILFFVFLSYVGSIWVLFGILPSISDSYYAWNKDLRVLFTLFCWGLAFPLIILQPNPLFFFSAAGFLFVGTAAQIKESYVAKVHNISASISIVSGIIGVAITLGFWYISLGALIAAGILKLLKIPHLIWWIEILAFLAISTGLILDVAKNQIIF